MVRFSVSLVPDKDRRAPTRGSARSTQVALREKERGGESGNNPGGKRERMCVHKWGSRCRWRCMRRDTARFVHGEAVRGEELRATQKFQNLEEDKRRPASLLKTSPGGGVARKKIDSAVVDVVLLSETKLRLGKTKRLPTRSRRCDYCFCGEKRTVTKRIAVSEGGRKARELRNFVSKSSARGELNQTAQERETPKPVWC